MSTPPRPDARSAPALAPAPALAFALAPALALALALAPQRAAAQSASGGDDGARDWAIASAITGLGVGAIGLSLSVATISSERELKSGLLLSSSALSVLVGPFSAIAALQAPESDVSAGAQTIGWLALGLGLVFGILTLVEWLERGTPDPMTALVGTVFTMLASFAFGFDGLARALEPP